MTRRTGASGARRRPAGALMRAAGLCTCLAALAAQPAAAAETRPAPPDPPAPTDPYKDLYKDYRPAFGDPAKLPPNELMKLSTEPMFFTLNRVHEDARANALVKAGLEREKQNRYRDALKMYQIVIERHPHELYRVSEYGVFAPVSQYCQRRILHFPPADLDHYRILYDARARDAFERARRKNSLIGLSEIVDRMLATSYGSKAIAELGNAALDSGHYLAALERFSTVRDFFPAADRRGPQLDLKIAYCRRMLGGAAPTRTPRGSARTPEPTPVEKQLERLVAAIPPGRRPVHSQRASPGAVAADDHSLFPPTVDPMGLAEPAWQHDLPGSRDNFYVFTQPAVTRTSLIYRHQNIVYCRSILNGELRWVNDLGGRAIWQNRAARRYPQEDLIVQDGLVFTVLSKGGPSLVALDEVTGQLRWAFGPMVASTEEEARMRFEAAPAAGPRTIYAGYVLDNIEGDTHTDTEYGLIAFESTTGRLLWRTPLCRLAPGKFSTGFAVRARNRIRSFMSPPLYHQGTVYHTTNAGAIAALDARSGRVKWLMRHPYHSDIHDATRQFGRGGGRVRYTRVVFTPHEPMIWYEQRPLLIGEKLYVLPVDAPDLLCLDRRTGKVVWTRRKGLRSERGYARSGGSTYLVGPLRTGELALVYSHRNRPVHLIDPNTGRTVWVSPPHVEDETAPAMRYWTPAMHSGTRLSSAPINNVHYETAARPTVTADGRLYMTGFFYWGWPVYGYVCNLCEYDLAARKRARTRRYYDGSLLATVHSAVYRNSPVLLRALEEKVLKDDKTRQLIKHLRLIVNSYVPANLHGPFFPFSRVTFRRHGVPFELRFGARRIAMVYDRAAVARALAGRAGPDADFARAELAFADARYARAAGLLRRCLRTMSSEDFDFRGAVNQQLYQVHRRLARSGIRSGDSAKELANCLGMSRTCTTLADEVETLFALAEAYERQGDLDRAAGCLRSVIRAYGHHEYPVPEHVTCEPGQLSRTARKMLDRVEAYAGCAFFAGEFRQPVNLCRKELPLHLSTVSTLPRTLTVRAGELAVARLLRLQRQSPEFARRLETLAARELVGRPPDEQLHRLWGFPGAPTGKKVLEELFERAARKNDEAGQRRLWRLADTARVCGFHVPPAHRGRVLAPPPAGRPGPIRLPQTARTVNLAEAEGINWLVLPQRGDRTKWPRRVFLGGRVRKRLDNKFILKCLDLDTGKRVWDARRIRLKGRGQEPGFFEALVHADLLIVHGLYDVLAFEARDGTLRWRYRVPFNFEIRSAILSGDLLFLGARGETLALYVGTAAPNGEVVWQVKEMGDPYAAPYVFGDRLVSVRMNPFNVTVRFRATGRLIGRLALPDLSLFDDHPLLADGPRARPIAHDGKRLVVSDGWYYILIDVERVAVLWKRLIDMNDLTRQPAMRFVLNGDYFAVLKEDYDRQVIYMLSSRTGNVLWHTDPKNARSPQPIHSMFIRPSTGSGQAAVYGIGVHPGQAFYFVGMDCRTGRLLFRREIKGYDYSPIARLIPRDFAGRAVVDVQDAQDFELKVFDLQTGKLLHTLKAKGVGPFGVHGRVSATVQNGRLILLSKDTLRL